MSDLLQRLQSGLAGRYTLERELGHGGMATVYLARDSKHDRLVALKVLRPELAVALGPERFHREIMLVARLQHPHILSVDDSGTGVAVGTPAYMSPEQASGERQLDGRTDVYALGCVLYEALAGEPPFTGPTAQAIIAQALTETPRPLRATRAGVSEALDAVIARALAKSPADRFTSVAQFARALGAAGEAGPAPRAGGASVALALLRPDTRLGVALG